MLRNLLADHIRRVLAKRHRLVVLSKCHQISWLRIQTKAKMLKSHYHVCQRPYIIRNRMIIFAIYSMWSPIALVMAILQLLSVSNWSSFDPIEDVVEFFFLISFILIIFYSTIETARLWITLIIYFNIASSRWFADKSLTIDSNCINKCCW